MDALNDMEEPEPLDVGRASVQDELSDEETSSDSFELLIDSPDHHSLHRLKRKDQEHTIDWSTPLPRPEQLSTRGLPPTPRDSRTRSCKEKALQNILLDSSRKKKRDDAYQRWQQTTNIDENTPRLKHRHPSWYCSPTHWSDESSSEESLHGFVVDNEYIQWIEDDSECVDTRPDVFVHERQDPFLDDLPDDMEEHSECHGSEDDTPILLDSSEEDDLIPPLDGRDWNETPQEPIVVDDLPSPPPSPQPLPVGDETVFDVEEEQNLVVFDHPGAAERSSKWNLQCATGPGPEQVWAKLHAALRHRKREDYRKSGRDSFAANREALATAYFHQYNETVFDGRLPDIPIVWEKKTGARGFCVCHRKGRTRSVPRIALVPKWNNTDPDLRRVLLHEMCHAAAWLFDNCRNHSKKWVQWTKIAERKVPELEGIDYSWEYPYFCSNAACGKR